MHNGMVLTDLDGTFLNSAGQISPTNLDTLHHLGQNGVIRVAATGRTLHSSREVVPHNLPFDYLIFSTGAGICSFADDNVICSHELQEADIHALAEFFLGCGIDFSIHHPIPENHRFHWYASPNPTPDLLSRLKYLKDFAMQGNYRDISRATQFLAISLNGLEIIDDLRNKFAHLSIIRTTSPIDGQHVWIEVFPGQTSKGEAASWLCRHLGIDRCHTMSIGNDYNDLAMLEWTQHAFVVENSPADMRQRFKGAPRNDEHGFSVAARSWLQILNK
ncbi:MAG: HAD family phosphatase [Erysipelotrichia bacterium]|nr:HAD family hydrolase [Candidatus Riflebacteria bacterium]NCB39233.1 HAD family phosphatase [Erysipelotrichia bacterium]